MRYGAPAKIRAVGCPNSTISPAVPPPSITGTQRAHIHPYHSKEKFQNNHTRPCLPAHCGMGAAKLFSWPVPGTARDRLASCTRLRSRPRQEGGSRLPAGTLPHPAACPFRCGHAANSFRSMNLMSFVSKYGFAQEESFSSVNGSFVLFALPLFARKW